MLTGPEVVPKNGNKPKQLILLLHGVGADGNNLLDIAHQLSPLLPDAHFISPNAPNTYDIAPIGYQWFSLRDTSEEALLKGLEEATPYLNEFIDQQLKRFNLTEENMAVIGFSQGTMLALHSFPRRTRPIALIAALSGTLIAPHLLKKELKSKPKVLFMYGEQDQVLPAKYMRLASQYLKDLNFNTEIHTYPDLEHSINQDEIIIIADRLKKIFHSEYS
ncbi:MAG: dienelactone hydrolase family protein [Rickettsiales bacterium]|nr:dienelactone hydrolase family protein [Rickettsiales bacterium]